MFPVLRVIHFLKNPDKYKNYPDITQGPPAIYKNYDLRLFAFETPICFY
jgi:hypothetical protein